MTTQSGTAEISPLLSKWIAEAFFIYKIEEKEEDKIMSGILMMVIAIVVLGGAYLLYGRYLQNKWGIVPKAKTPAYEMEE